MFSEGLFPYYFLSVSMIHRRAHNELWTAMATYLQVVHQ